MGGPFCHHRVVRRAACGHAQWYALLCCDLCRSGRDHRGARDGRDVDDRCYPCGWIVRNGMILPRVRGAMIGQHVRDVQDGKNA